MSYSRRQSDVRAARSEKDRAAVKVAMVVKVLAFYPDSMMVDVQPLNKEKIDGEYASASPIMGIRVASINSGEFVIRPWYKRGDTGIVIVSDHDTDSVMENGGEEAEPNTARNHDPADGIFIGGICPAGKAPSGLPENALVLAAGGVYLAVTPDGISIQGDVTIQGGVTISDNLSASGIEMTTHTHAYSEGGGETSGPG